MKKITLLCLLLNLHFLSEAQTASADSLMVYSGTTKDTIGIFTKVEVEADYPGGIDAWRQFLVQNLRGEAVVNALPKKVRSFQETAIVQFIVCTDGSICNVQVVNKVHPAVKQEAERVIKASGTWNPAAQSGRQVKAYRRQPITFVVTPN